MNGTSDYLLLRAPVPFLTGRLLAAVFADLARLAVAARAGAFLRVAAGLAWALDFAAAAGADFFAVLRATGRALEAARFAGDLARAFAGVLAGALPDAFAGFFAAAASRAIH